MSLSHDLKKAPLCLWPAPERNWNFRPPVCTNLDISPTIAILRVEMEERHTLEIKDAVRPFGNTWKPPELAEYVLEVEKIFMPSVPHASVSPAV
jgi:hypothetical protein